MEGSVPFQTAAGDGLTHCELMDSVLFCSAYSSRLNRAKCWTKKQHINGPQASSSMNVACFAAICRWESFHGFLSRKRVVGRVFFFPSTSLSSHPFPPPQLGSPLFILPLFFSLPLGNISIIGWMIRNMSCISPFPIICFCPPMRSRDRRDAFGLI